MDKLNEASYYIPMYSLIPRPGLGTGLIYTYTMTCISVLSHDACSTVVLYHLYHWYYPVYLYYNNSTTCILCSVCVTLYRPCLLTQHDLHIASLGHPSTAGIAWSTSCTYSGWLCRTLRPALDNVVHWSGPKNLSVWGHFRTKKLH